MKLPSGAGTLASSPSNTLGTSYRQSLDIGFTRSPGESNPQYRNHNLAGPDLVGPAEPRQTPPARIGGTDPTKMSENRPGAVVRVCWHEQWQSRRFTSSSLPNNIRHRMVLRPRLWQQPALPVGFLSAGGLLHD